VATILVVDDNAINRKVLIARLSSDGYVTVEACDGADGLKAAHAHRPQLIISDILMPTMDGFEFVRVLRREPLLRDTPVIFYTAHYHEREAHNLAQACGVSQVLVKPCTHAELVRAVEQALTGVGESNLTGLPEGIDREHLRLLTDKLSERANALAASNARFTALADLYLEIASQCDPHAVLERVCAGARNLLGSQFAVLAVAEEGADQGVYFKTSGINDERAPLLPPDLYAGPLGHVLAQRLPWRTRGPPEEAQDPGFPRAYPKASAYLAVPLTTPARAYGWLCLADKIGALSFDEFDEQLLLTMGAAVGTVYENIGLQAELRRQQAKLARGYALLSGANALIAHADDRDEVCNEACRLCVERAQYRLAFVEIAEAHGGEASFIVGAGEPSDFEKLAWRPRIQCEADELVEIALSTETPAVCNDLKSTPLKIRRHQELLTRGYRSIAVLPLNGCIRGRLILLADERDVFDPAELRLLSVFAGGVSLALAHAMERASERLT
jgi:CheY-like chemotaxis protein/GAF domain-containing protein